jgi:hypothetical protein
VSGSPDHKGDEDKVAKANAGLKCVDTKFSCEWLGLARTRARAAVQVCAFSASVAGLAAFGCGNPVANLVISAPSTVIAGSGFTITVTAMAGGSRDKIINSSIHFTSSDIAAVLPGDYYYTAADAGSHTFSGIILISPGSQSITATVPSSPGITGTTNVTVSAASAATQF